MLDSEKLDLIKDLIVDYWETGNVSEDSAVSLINAITVVADFERKDKKEC